MKAGTDTDNGPACTIGEECPTRNTTSSAVFAETIEIRMPWQTMSMRGLF